MVVDEVEHSAGKELNGNIKISYVFSAQRQRLLGEAIFGDTVEGGGKDSVLGFRER